MRVLERVRGRIADRLAIAQLPNFTVSFGVASSDQAGQLEQVVALADEALLAAKSGGRDQIVVAVGADQPSVRAWVDEAPLASDGAVLTGDHHAVSAYLA